MGIRQFTDLRGGLGKKEGGGFFEGGGGVSRPQCTLCVSSDVILPKFINSFSAVS